MSYMFDNDCILIYDLFIFRKLIMFNKYSTYFISKVRTSLGFFSSKTGSRFFT